MKDGKMITVIPDGVRGNRAMIAKVYEFADQAPVRDAPVPAHEQRERRIAAQLKRERRNAKRAQS